MAEQTRVPLQPNGERYNYVSLSLATNPMLEEVMRLGVTPVTDDIVGWEFRGWNTFDLTPLMGIRKFKKGFYSKPDGGLGGYNVKPEQNGLGEPWIDRIHKGTPIRHGWYDVYPVRLTEVDNKYPNGLLINYNCDKNLPIDPTRNLRDYLVQVYPDDKDLLLGKAYVALGPLRVFVSYFVLGRENRSRL